MAMTASCEACMQNMTVEAYCEINPDMEGCSEEPTICCDAINASCEACHIGISIEDYCKVFSGMDGCDGAEGDLEELLLEF